ncbi:16S rRNA (guanine(966)-N(2))-methyltransferase RsmD [Pacificimonas flava]|nr:16S rRNA (guanine(966)-N(2))-methyltransferase RsmD [Pacificimonas flava]
MQTIRIIGGKWRGRSLAAPQGASTRPTSARAREALFSMLLSEIGTFDGFNVADLFAGTGALGLEALSRGAAHVIFVEDAPPALTALRSNITRFSAESHCTVLPRRAPALPQATAPVHLAFLDAPYEKGLTGPTLSALMKQGWLAPGALVSAEIAAEESLPVEALETLRDRRYGKARILLFRHAA